MDGYGLQTETSRQKLCLVKKYCGTSWTLLKLRKGLDCSAVCGPRGVLLGCWVLAKTCLVSCTSFHDISCKLVPVSRSVPYMNIMNISVPLTCAKLLQRATLNPSLPIGLAIRSPRWRNWWLSVPTWLGSDPQTHLRF